MASGTTPEVLRGRAGHRASVALAAAVAALMAVPLLPGTAWGNDFSNRTPIRMPMPGPPPGCPGPNACVSDKANPYPSSIAVSGMTGTVTDVNVTIHDLTYTKDGPPDIDMMLVSPDNKAVWLMSDDCGDNDHTNPITTPITLTFDDQAAAPIPADAPCSSGTFKPLDDDDDGETIPESFKAPDNMPDAPTPPAGTLPLSTFNGGSPNGDWKLYMVDDAPTDPDPNGIAGQIAGGWTISIATTTGSSTGTTTPAGTTATTARTTATTARTTATTVTRGGVTGTTVATGTTPARTGSATARLALLAAAAIVLGSLLVLSPRALRRPRRR